MELTYTWVYTLVALLTHDLLRGHAGGLWRALGAAFWPVTFALALVAGVLLLPLVVLALIGHAISWYRGLGSWRLHPQ